MQFVTVNGVSIHFRAELNKSGLPVIVFSNSLGTDFRIWDDVAGQLRDRFNMVFYDKRGHGLSDIGPTPYAMSDHAADLIALLEHLRVPRAVICGLSVGGLIAQAVYHARPDLVAALVLCDTAAKISSEELWNARIKTVTEQGIEPIAGPILERWFSAAYRSEDNPSFRAYRNMLVRTTAQGYASTGIAIRDADYTAQASAIAVPVLCVVGEHDGATSPELVRATAQRIPGARFEIIAGAGHLPNIERPNELARLMLAFLNENGLAA